MYGIAYLSKIDYCLTADVRNCQATHNPPALSMAAPIRSIDGIIPPGKYILSKGSAIVVSSSLSMACKEKRY
jgi:hypothetical protein